MLQTASIPADGLRAFSRIWFFKVSYFFFSLPRLQVFVHRSLILIALIQLFLVYSPDS